MECRAPKQGLMKVHPKIILPGVGVVKYVVILYSYYIVKTYKEMYVRNESDRIKVWMT